MIRRRRTVVGARRRWGETPWARALNSQAGMAAITPRVERIIDLLELAPGRRYVDIGCGTAAFAHLIASRARMEEPPLCLDLAAAPGQPVDVLAWPEHLPLRDESVDCATILYYLRRFDDDVVHGLGGELRRVLAPGGAALLLEVAPVESSLLNRAHTRLLAGGCAAVDLRGWGRLAALLTECGFDGINLVNIGPFLLPPIPRLGVLVRVARARSAMSK